MRRLLNTKLLILLFLLTFGPQTIKASKYNDLFYHLYVHGEMVEWIQVLNQAKAEFDKNPKPHILEDIVRAQYGLCAFYLGNSEDDKALQEIESALILMDKLDMYYPNQGWIYALRASFESFKLIISPFRFFFKGPAILSSIRKSNELAPDQVDVMFLKANQTFYMPSILGGDQQEGLEYFKILESKLLTHNIQKEKNWFFLLYLTSHAIACNAAGEYDEAVRIYKTILVVEPDYLWVKKELLPQSLKKQENEYLKRRKEKVDKKI